MDCRSPCHRHMPLPSCSTATGSSTDITRTPFDPEDLVLLPGTQEALHGLKRLGYRVTVITNQTGVAKGLEKLSESTTSDLRDRSSWVLRRLALAETIAGWCLRLMCIPLEFTGGRERRFVLEEGA
jgi:hypothetical protein